MNKAIAQWDRGRKADLSLCGHFHQIFDGNNFITNGSLIGFNAYAINIKAAFEPPAQVYFGIHSKHGRILNRKIVFS
jgi:hypothetical protein